MMKLLFALTMVSAAVLLGSVSQDVVVPIQDGSELELMQIRNEEYPQPSTPGLRYPTAADATISKLNSETKFGLSDTLLVHKSSDAELISYIKFDLVDTQIDVLYWNASLLLHLISGLDEDIAKIDLYFVDDNSWEEGNLTWTNAPGLLILAAADFSVENDMVQWVLDPDQVQQRRDRYLTIALVAREETVGIIEFSSRETNQPPVLPAWGLTTGPEVLSHPILPPRLPTGPIDVPVDNTAFRTYSVALVLVGVTAGVLVGFLFLRRRR